MKLLKFSNTWMYIKPQRTHCMVIFVVFLASFTLRLVPAPSSDRAVFISVGEYLLSGNQLYVDIYDNKDPLFFYLVSLQRLLGAGGEYLFELAMVTIAAVSAYSLAIFLRAQRRNREIFLLLAIPLLITGEFWLPGYTHLPATALSLFACALFLRGKNLWAGGCVGLIVFIKLIMMPLPIVFCFAFELVASGKRNAIKVLAKMALGLASVAMILCAALLMRGEFQGYLSAQANNFLYANSILVDNANFLRSVFSHLRTVFGDSTQKITVLISLLLNIGFITWAITRPKSPGKVNAFWVGTLSTYIMSILILGLTGIWSHHLQIIYFSHSLMLVCIAVTLNKRKVVATSLFGVLLMTLAMLFSGTIDPTHYVLSPSHIMQKVSHFTQESREMRVFREIYPNGTGFARFGQNSNVIPHGAANDELVCPEFAQYPFYSTERFQSILSCAQTAKTLIVDDSFVPIERASYGPRDAQKEILMRNWNIFVAAGEEIINTRFSCRELGTIRVCDSIEEP